FDASNWNQAQAVAVTPVDDLIVDGSIGYDIDLSTSGSAEYEGKTATVRVTNEDDDVASLMVAPTALTTTEVGQPQTFTVRLTSEPLATVTVTVVSTNTTEGTVSPASLTFDASNWNQAQAVAVTPVDDLIVDGSIGYDIDLSASGSAEYEGKTATVRVTNEDDDHELAVNVTGLLGSGLSVSNAGSTYPIAANGEHTLTPLASGTAYSVSVSAQPTSPWQTCVVTNPSGTITNAKVVVEIACTTDTYELAVNVSGLSGSGFTLSNAGTAYPIAANGETVLTSLASGTTYGVTVSAQPIAPDQLCTITNPAGTIQDAKITVQIACVASYALAVNVTGLVGDALTLSNAGNDYPIAVDGEHVLAFFVSGTAYDVAISAQPTSPWQTCSLTNASGTITDAMVVVEIACATDSYDLAVNVTGLAGSGNSCLGVPRLTVTNDGIDYSIAANGESTLITLASGTDYDVAITVQPTTPLHNCTVASPSGTIQNADVVLDITCVPEDLFDLAVNVTGLVGAGLTLTNAGTDYPIPSNGPHQLATSTSWAPTSLTISAQPTAPTQICAVTNSGSALQGDTVNIEIACSAALNADQVAGAVKGLLMGSDGVLLSLNADSAINPANPGEQISVDADGYFVFPATQLTPGEAYVVRVVDSPTSQLCDVEDGRGFIGANAVTDVMVICRTVDTSMLYMNRTMSRNIFELMSPKFPEMQSISTSFDFEATYDLLPAFMIFHRGNSSYTSDITSNLTPGLIDYMNCGGIIITEMNTSHQVYNYLFGTSYQFSASYGGCSDMAPTDVQFTSDDPFWQDIPFMTPADYGSSSGCGYDISNLPGITPLAGWSPSTVAIGYIDYGLGRLWFLDVDWQDGQNIPQFTYTSDIINYMASHRR
ncbi:MAG: hypothetical protein LBM75_03005, partial [Myxococcales bacterium]|nr:hypothetical protein [Myxococcales bacterium]